MMSGWANSLAGLGILADKGYGELVPRARHVGFVLEQRLILGRAEHAERDTIDLLQAVRQVSAQPLGNEVEELHRLVADTRHQRAVAVSDLLLRELSYSRQTASVAASPSLSFVAVPSTPIARRPSRP